MPPARITILQLLGLLLPELTDRVKPTGECEIDRDKVIAYVVARAGFMGSRTWGLGIPDEKILNVCSGTFPTARRVR